MTGNITIIIVIYWKFLEHISIKGKKNIPPVYTSRDPQQNFSK